MNSNSPIVTVICLCYNHEKFVAEALDSVENQSYEHLQVILIDDCSTDDSASILEKYAEKNPEWKLIRNTENLGNCKAFNKAFAMAHGKYVIDFSTDDVMMSDRVSRQVEYFESLDDSYGVIYSDAVVIDESSNQLGKHFAHNADPPSGDVYLKILERYFICPPTMMMKYSVLKELGGYDEKLAYEDFDFWVRSSKKYKYGYQPDELTSRRLVKGSLSLDFYSKNSRRMHISTIKVIQKAMMLTPSKEEKKALSRRISYEMRQALFSKNFLVVKAYFQLLDQLGRVKMKDEIIRLFASVRWSLKYLSRSAKGGYRPISI